MLLITDRRLNKAKPRGAQLDWRHPLCDQLLFYVPFNEGAGAPDNMTRARAYQAVALAPPSWTATSKYGLALDNGYANGAENQSNMTRWFPTGPSNNDREPATIFGIGQLRAAATLTNDQFLFILTSSETASGNNWAILRDGASGTFRVLFNGGASNSISFDTTKEHVFAATRVPVSNLTKMYIDGGLVLTTTIPGSAATGLGSCYTGNNAVGGGPGNRAWQGAISCVAFWRRILNQGEIEAMTENPYQILTPQLYRRYFFKSQAPAPPASLSIFPIINMPIQMP